MKNLLKTTLILAVCAACSHKETTSQTPPPVATSDPTSVAANIGTAQALMKPGKNQKTKGIVHFTQVGDKLKIEAMLEKLKPGPHGIHIHETGDCSAADFASAGGHYNPGQSHHGSLDSSERHAGDLGNITANAKGSAKISMEVSGLSLGGANNIVGKALVVHGKADDFKSQPAGNSGDRVACGVIEAN
jgi:Cu-Zn family superoxide dismutase